MKIKTEQELYSKLSKISADFTSASKENVDEVINRALKIIGDFVKADRAYIFHYDLVKKTAVNTYEYCSKGIMPVIDILEPTPLDDVLEWFNTHLSGNKFYIKDVLSLDERDNIRMVLEPQGVKSLLTLPLFKDKELYGFIGFDSVKDYHVYSDFELKVLTEFSVILVNLLKRIDLEKRIVKERLRFEYVSEASNIGVWELDVQTGQVVINKEWAKIIGYDLKELGDAT